MANAGPSQPVVGHVSGQMKSTGLSSVAPPATARSLIYVRSRGVCANLLPPRTEILHAQPSPVLSRTNASTRCEAFLVVRNKDETLLRVARKLEPRSVLRTQMHRCERGLHRSELLFLHRDRKTPSFVFSPRKLCKKPTNSKNLRFLEVGAGQYIKISIYS